MRILGHMCTMICRAIWGIPVVLIEDKVAPILGPITYPLLIILATAIIILNEMSLEGYLS